MGKVVPLSSVPAPLYASLGPEMVRALSRGRAALDAAERVVRSSTVAWAGAWYADQISRRLAAFSGPQDLDEIKRLLLVLQGQVAALQE